MGIYELHSSFQHSYYSRVNLPMLDYEEFIYHGTIIVLDASRQLETVIAFSIDIRVLFETERNVPGITSALCLIMHDTIVSHHPQTGLVVKGI